MCVCASPCSLSTYLCFFLQEELYSLRLQLEERNQQELDQLRSRMTLVYKEDLLQARTELTDRYYKDIDQLNTKHAHELEQLRAKLSDNHIKGEALFSVFQSVCHFGKPWQPLRTPQQPHLHI